MTVFTDSYATDPYPAVSTVAEFVFAAAEGDVVRALALVTESCERNCGAKQIAATDEWHRLCMYCVLKAEPIGPDQELVMLVDRMPGPISTAVLACPFLLVWDGLAWRIDAFGPAVPIETYQHYVAAAAKTSRSGATS